MRQLLLISLLSLCVSTSMAYDEFDESEPDEAANHSRGEYWRYRHEVEDYVAAAQDYIDEAERAKNLIDPMDEYADEETAEISRRQEEAQEKAEGVVDQFNDWAERRY